MTPETKEWYDMAAMEVCQNSMRLPHFLTFSLGGLLSGDF